MKTIEQIITDTKIDLHKRMNHHRRNIGIMMNDPSDESVKLKHVMDAEILEGESAQLRIVTRLLDALGSYEATDSAQDAADRLYLQVQACNLKIKCHRRHFDNAIKSGNMGAVRHWAAELQFWIKALELWDRMRRDLLNGVK